MSTLKLPINSPVPPSLRVLLDATTQNLSYDLNCHQVGVIESYDSSRQTASVRIAVLRTLGTENLPYPLLTDCPVLVPAGGAGYMTFPIAAGDPCLVLFNDRDLDNWFVSGGTQTLNSERAHSLSDGMVLVGIRNLTNPPPTSSATSVDIHYAGGSLAVGESPKLEGSGGAKVVASSTVDISNSATSLKAALDSLCSALSAWVNTGGSTPNPATLAAIAAAKNQIDSVLT